MHAEYSRLYQQLDDALSPLGLFFPNLPLPAMIGRDKARKRFCEIFAKIIKERKESNEEHEDMLQTFIEAEYDDGTKFTDDEIVGMLIALMFAGQHTRKQVLEEQKELVPEGTRLNLTLIKSMRYLDNCMRESLRLRPPIIVVMRRAVKDLEYQGYHIPKGSLVSVWPGLSHLLGEYFMEPEKFDPARFDEPRKEHHVGPFRYFPFGAASHACTGEQFAFVQVKTILSTLFRNYDIKLTVPFPKQDFTTMIPGPIHPVTIRYKRIQSKQ